MIDTKIYKIDPNNMDTNLLDEAAKILKEGGLVAFATETVYGLGADASNKEASNKIYKAKGRPSDNPLIVHISKKEDVQKIAYVSHKDAKALMDKFWPGPMTLILKKKDIIPFDTTGGLDTVAVRMPDHKVALELIKRSGCFVAAPSANTSGRPSPTKAAHVIEDMTGRVDAIVDSGDVNIGIESTIIDLTVETPMILRPGFITNDMIKEIIDDVITDPALLDNSKGEFVPKAPGMKYKHYAPKADLTMFKGDIKKVIDKINVLAFEAKEQGKKVGIIATSETKDAYECGEVLVIGDRIDEKSIAANIYSVLRDFDLKEVDVIYSETFYSRGLGEAIMNRLTKAAGYKVEEV